MAKAELTDNQLNAIQITERVCSVLSLLGTTFIITTFLSSKAFYKPINRLVCYAAVGNVFANVATMISRSGITVGGGLCQFEGFLIQLFLPADAMWTLAMACNVYLTFFHKYDARQLRSLEWKYVVACYGIPFIPAIVFFFIKNSQGASVYGNAVLWCWISIEWDWLRIAAFYAPVWVIILTTLGIYIACGKVIYEKRKQLRNFSESHSHDTPVVMVENPFMSTKTTEVHISSELAASDASSEEGRPRDEENPADTKRHYDPYSISIGTGPNADNRQSRIQVNGAARAPRVRVPRTAARDANTAAIAYAKVSLLFFLAILVTWVPSTINRVYSLVHPDGVSYGLSYLSSLVLPLQGFWNSVIYICTSIPAIKSLWRDMTDSLSSRRSSSRQPIPPIVERPLPTYRRGSPFNSRPITARTGKDSLDDESESTKGFARAS